MNSPLYSLKNGDKLFAMTTTVPRERRELKVPLETVTAAARRVGRARATLVHAIKTGKLPAYVIGGGATVVKPSDVDRLYGVIPVDEELDPFNL